MSILGLSPMQAGMVCNGFAISLIVLSHYLEIYHSRKQAHHLKRIEQLIEARDSAAISEEVQAFHTNTRVNAAIEGSYWLTVAGGCLTLIGAGLILSGVVGGPL